MEERKEGNVIQEDLAYGGMFISVAAGMVFKSAVCQLLREVVLSWAPSNHIACHNPDVPYSPNPRGLEHAVSLHGLPFLQTIRSTSSIICLLNPLAPSPTRASVVLGFFVPPGSHEFQ